MEREKKRKIKKKEEGGRETGAAWGPVNRLVLNSNNVGNSKHFIQSKRKPQSLGCLCAVAAGLCSLGRMGGRWAGWHHRATGSRAGAETQTNTASSVLELRDQNSGQPHGPVLTRILGVCRWAVGDWNASYWCFFYKQCLISHLAANRMLHRFQVFCSLCSKLYSKNKKYRELNDLSL